MCWSGSPGTPGMDSVQEAEKRTGKMFNVLQRILFDAIICRIRKIKTSHF